MLSAGLNPNDSLSGDESLLTIAVEAGVLENVRTLIDAGADVDAMGRFGNSVASSAVYTGHADILELLFEKGASINFKVYEEPPLLAATQFRHEDVVEVLLAWNVDINEAGTPDAYSGTPLAWAARIPDENIFYQLFHAKAKTDFIAPDGMTLLHWAAKGGNEQIVSTILEEGADPHVADTWGTTPLASAFSGLRYSRGPEIVKIFMKHNVDIERRIDADGNTALCLAASLGLTEPMQLLLEANADPSAKNRKGQTPIHLATQKGFIHAVYAVLKYGQRDGVSSNPVSFIDEPDEKGRTPLFLATLYSQKDIVELLLYYGSSAQQTATFANRTPLSATQEHLQTSYGSNDEDVHATWKLLNQESIQVIDCEKMRTTVREWEDFEATCDTCESPISSYDTLYHCDICAQNNFDLCQECVSDGETCLDRTHTWRRMIIVGDRWKYVSDSLDQESTMEEFAHLRVT
ncbi:uncharacterized protein N7469_001101 [Penicillium citrinum]|uniref:Uncharacterized protein n=1 Tax=Penicillium citrinum TaxID=5077 RepID=A0A9W9PGB2_PENCI|nr:uncharacterized protein N7469_001101 [Penicillium citrinum]KAJ5242774.1 hypothetical protein N7469_001101 [Penicillium citrinum]